MSFIIIYFQARTTACTGKTRGFVFRVISLLLLLFCCACNVQFKAQIGNSPLGFAIFLLRTIVTLHCFDARQNPGHSQTLRSLLITTFLSYAHARGRSAATSKWPLGMATESAVEPTETSPQSSMAVTAGELGE